MFVGRERELSVLRERYDSPSFEFVGIYGRRRVGKTSLISQFVRDLPCGYCTAIEDDASANLRLLSRAVHSLANPDANEEIAPLYSSFSDAIDAAFAHARTRRCVLVIDEFPYLAKSYPAFPSILQAAIDRNKDESGLFLILCGSSLSFMKEQLLGRNSPLYGRRTAQIELLPFDFFGALRFFDTMSPIDVANIYGMVGGIPLYLRQFDQEKTLSQNVERIFLDPSSMLYEEPNNLLKQEVSKAAPYNAVLSSIAGGASQHNEIATKAGLESNALDYYLKELARIGLVTKEEPVTGEGRRRAVWQVADRLFKFWYRFVRPRQTLIERGMGPAASQHIMNALPEHMGPVFEDICRDWLWKQFAEGSLGFEVTDIGRWWGNDPIERSQAEIDIVALDMGSTMLVGECKWQGATMGADQLRKLDRHARLAGGGPITRRWLFSREGYTSGCNELARQMDLVRLLTFDEMVSDQR
jgi:AAA+ ATPase superfamily predicted ATPase